MLNTALCHFCNAGLILVLILGWAVFYFSGFFAISVLSFSCCTANNNLLCFCDLFCSTKAKTYECEAIQKHNEPHGFTQKITGNRKTAFLHQDCWIMFRFFHRYQKALLHNATKAWKYGGDTVLCKQCQEVTCLLFVLQTKQIVSHIPPSVCARLCLHLVPTGYIDSVWVLVRSTSKHKSSE